MADKNYLGLGVVFRGIDDGFDKTIKSVQTNLGRTTRMMDSLKDSLSDSSGMNLSPGDMDNLNKYNDAMSGMFQPSVRKSRNEIEKFGLKVSKLSAPLRHMGNSLSDAGKRMIDLGSKAKDTFGNITLLKILSDTEPFQRLLSGTQEIPQYVKDYDMLGAKMRVAFDPAPVEAFMQSVDENMANFGVSANDALKLAQTMNQFGVSLEKSTAVMPMMGKMVGILRMDTENVATMFSQTSKTLGIMPTDMTKLVKRVNAMGKAWNIMDFVVDLPEVVSSVADNMRKLGKVDARVAAQTIESTMKLKAKYTALGLGTKQATEAAIKMGNKITSLRDSILDLQAGLEPQDTDLFDKVLPELVRVTGQDAASIYQNLMTMGPDAINDMLVKQAQSMEDGPGKNRFMRTMKSVFGDEIYRQMVGGDALDKATAEANKKMAGLDPEKVLDEQTMAMRNTYQVTMDLKKANDELYDIQKKMAYKDAFLKMVNAQIEAIQNLQDIISSATTENEKLMRSIILNTDALKTGGIATVAYMHGLDGVGEAAAKSSIYIREISNAAEALQSALAGLGVGVNFIMGALGSLVNMSGMLLTKLASVGSVITKTGKGLGRFFGWWKGVFAKPITDPMLKATEELLKVDTPLTRLQGRLNSVVNTIREFKGLKSISDFFKSLAGPEKIISSLANSVKEFRLFQSVGEWISKGLSVSESAFSSFAKGFSRITKMIDTVKAFGSGLWEAFESFGSKIIGKFTLISESASGIFGKILTPLKALGPIISKLFAPIQAILLAFDTFKLLKMDNKDRQQHLEKFAQEQSQKGILGQVWSGFADPVTAFASLADQIAQVTTGDYTNLEPDIKPKAMDNVVNPELSVPKIMDKVEPKSNVIPFPKQTPKVTTPVLDAKPAPVIPLNQPGAPRRATLGESYKPTIADEGVQALIVAIDDLKVGLTDRISTIAERPVTVTIVGDMKKFIRVMNAQARDAGTSGELQNALGG